jgi:hypothetical protein
MVKYHFTCPHCRHKIRCDASSAGLHINCPTCQQIAIVPPAPRTIQIKVSTLRNVSLAVLGVLLVAGIVSLAPHLFGGSRTVTFKAMVDGVDVVKLSGNRLWIEHQSWKIPIKVMVNGKSWNPAWNDNTSMPFLLNRVFRPADPKNIKLASHKGRGPISIVELPAPANDETLAIKLDDGDFGAADWYEFTVSW